MPELALPDASFSLAASDGCALAGRKTGRSDAPAVILAHPIGFDGRFWTPVVDRLSNHFSIVVPDARGHGHSARGDGETSIDQLADDIVAVLDSLGIERAGFVGCSMGSMVGMRLGAKHPERFEWLILANAPARIPLPPEMFDRGIAAARAGDFPNMARGMLSRWLAPGTEAERPGWFATLLEEMIEVDGDGFADVFAALRDSDRNDDLARIGVPALVVTGEFDEAFPPATAATMADAIPAAEVAVVARAGHLAPVEQPDAFAELVLGSRKIPIHGP